MKPPESETDMGTKEDLAAYILRKSAKKLRSAQKDYKDACEDGPDGDFDDCASRAYYAAFFAVLSLHTMDGKSFARHGQAIGEFNKVYIKNGIFDRSYGAALTKMMITRHTGDYDPKKDISKAAAKESLEMAKRIVNDIQKYFAQKYPNVWELYEKIRPANLL